MIIWLASYPRSGNSLFANLVKHHVGISLYSIYKEDDYLSDVYTYLNQTDLQFATQSKDLFLVKTHELPLDDAPAIYLVRDGRDAIVSYAHYIIDNQINLPNPLPENLFAWALDILINSSDQFSGWGKHVQAWTARHPSKTVLVRYEDLNQETKQFDVFKSSLRELELDHLEFVNDKPLADFSKYNKLEPNFYRKGKSGSWIAEMPFEYHIKFWEQHGDSMQKLGYKNEEQNTIRTEFVLSEFSQVIEKKIEQIVTLTTHLETVQESNRQITLELLGAKEQIKQTQEKLKTLEEEKNLQLIEKEQELKTLEEEKNHQLVAKEEVIQNFRQSIRYSLIHGPFRSTLGKLFLAWGRLKGIRRKKLDVPVLTNSEQKELADWSHFEIVPIGINCDVGYFLREKSLRNFAYPFDWNVTPIQSVIELLENDFKDYLHEDNLVYLPPVPRMLLKEEGIDLQVIEDIITPVICRRYKILFPHDFSVQGKSDFAEVKLKYMNRVNRLMQLMKSDSEVLFVAYHRELNDWQKEQYSSVFGEPLINKADQWKSELSNVLSRKYKNLKFKLLELSEFKELIHSKQYS